MISGTLSDDSDRYVFDHIMPGSYYCKATAVSVAASRSCAFVVNMATGNVVLPTFEMLANYQALSTVTIRAARIID